MAVRNILFKLQADNREIKASLLEINKGLNVTNTNVEKIDKSFLDVGNSIDKAKKQLIGLVAAGKALDFGRESIQAASDFETINISFETFLGSAKEAKKVLKDLEDFSVSTPFTPEQVQNAGKALLAFGEPVEELETTLSRIGDIASGTGKDFNELSVIYGKARTSGTLYAEDINQLTEAGIPIIDEFAKQMGVSTGEVKKLASEGKIGFGELQVAFENLTSEGGRFEGLTKKLSESSAGRLSTLEGRFTEIKRTIGEGLLPVFEAVVEGGLQFIGFLKQLPAFIDRNRTVITLLTAATAFLVLQKLKIRGATQQEALATLRKNLIDKKDLIVSRLRSLSLKTLRKDLKGLTTAQKLSTLATRTGTGAVKAFTKAVKANPLGLLISGATIAIGLMGELGDETEKTTEELEEQKTVAEQLDEVRKQSTDQLSKEAGELKSKFLQLKNTKAESKDRLTLIKEINATYGTTIKNLSDEKAFVDQLSVAYRQVVEEIKNKIRIQSAEQQTTILLSETVKLEGLVEKDLKRIGFDDKGIEKFFKDRGQEVKTLQEYLQILTDANITAFELRDSKLVDSAGKELEGIQKDAAQLLGVLQQGGKFAGKGGGAGGAPTVAEDRAKPGGTTTGIGFRVNDEIAEIIKLTREAEGIIEDTAEKLGGFFSTIEEGTDAVTSTKKFKDIVTALQKELLKAENTELIVNIKTSELSEVEKLTELEKIKQGFIDKEIANRKRIVEQQRKQGEVTQAQADQALILLDEIKKAQKEALGESTSLKIFEVQQKLSQQRLQNLQSIADLQAKIDVTIIEKEIASLLELKKDVQEGRIDNAQTEIDAIDAQIAAAEKALKEELGKPITEEGDEKISSIEKNLSDLEITRDELEEEIDRLSDLSVGTLNDQLVKRLDEKYKILRDRIIDQAEFEIETEGKTAEEIQLIRLKRDLELLKLDEKYSKDRNKITDKTVEQEKEDAKEIKEAQKELVKQLKAFVDELLKARIAASERAITAQEKRVEKAKELADKGNVDILQAEENKLNTLQKQKEKFVRAQQALAAIELVAHATVAIAKAAAEGGAAAPFTIAATLLALAAGLVAAKAQAQAAAGSFAEGGYTGDGGRLQPAGTVHKGEWVFDQQKTRKFRPIFEQIQKGRNPFIGTELNTTVMQMNTAGVENRLDGIEKAIKGQSRLSLKIDEKGVHGMVSHLDFKRSRIRNKAR